MSFLDIFRVGKIKKENEQIKLELAEMQEKNNKLDLQLSNANNNYFELEQRYNQLSKAVSGETQKKLFQDIENLKSAKENAQQELVFFKENANAEKERLQKQLDNVLQSISLEQDKSDKKIQNAKIKLKLINTAFKAIQKSIDSDNNNQFDVPQLVLEAKSLVKDIEDLHINALDVPALKKLIVANRENIKNVITKYESRYTTKSNKALYQLMVLALESELQNVLLNLKFGTLEEAKNKINGLLEKYYDISSNGNQSIAPTIKKFIIEMETLYIEAIEIEYEYYKKKEAIKEEQRALKEQMRQEAEERKALEQQQKKLEKEENKYKNEIENVKIAISTSNENEVEALKKRLQELTEMLENVNEKKEKIINLQNGQAGYVYIISNIGSFGENIFKVGMTRRDEPQDRVDELGNASVPFPFDVHSFIFSSNAVELENRMHKILDSKRVNKINRRKEFFEVDINEIEHIVHEIEPSAEFKMTALAEQYNQSLSLKY